MSAELHRRIHDLCRDYMLGRIDAALAVIDDNIDFTIHAPDDLMQSGGRRRGKAALAALWLKAHSAYEYLSYRPHVLDGGDGVVAAVIAARLKHRANDDVLTLLIAKFVRFHEGRIVELHEFSDHADGVELSLVRGNGTSR